MRRAGGRLARTGAAALLLAGCYSYAPADPGMLRPDDRVRLHLTRQGQIDLPDLPRLGEAAVSGRLVASGGGEFRLRVPVGASPEGIGTRPVTQEVPIDALQVVRVEARRLDRFRTGLAVAGGVLAVTAVATGFGGLSTAAPEAPPEPKDEEAGVGRFVFRLSLPLR